MSEPDKIYLQWHGDADPADYPDGPDPSTDDVTWCHDKIYEHDVEYVRADIMRSTISRLEAENATLKIISSDTKNESILLLAKANRTISRLLRYAYHEEECAAITTHCGPMQPCDCGYDALMKEIGE